MKQSIFHVLFLLCAAVSHAAVSAKFNFPFLPHKHSSKCKKVVPINVNLTEWVRASWYVQQQQITGYQSIENLFCVVATYNKEHKKVPFFSGNVLAVHNYANKDKVNGEPSSEENKTVLCARQPDPKVTGKLLVAPCFLPNILSGDYWIIATGSLASDPSRLQWAVVSGGQPKVEYKDGCTTKETGTNGCGLWLFSRSPVANPGELNAARAAAVAKGFTLRRLHDVQQKDCKYNDAFIKY